MTWDYILVGGGLQSGLLSLALSHHQPGASVLLIERSAHFGGNHTWSFHAQDITLSAGSWAEKLYEHRWPSYKVRFPSYDRSVPLNYCSMSSCFLRKTLLSSVFSTTTPHRKLLTNHTAESVSAQQVRLTNGSAFQAQCVVDCRGPATLPIKRSHAGYQKFVGWEVELSQPWPNGEPLLMDVDSQQTDGFRFFYVLPFSNNRLLVEDTCFSDTPDFEMEAYRQRIAAYLQKAGVAWECRREESGCLPMPFDTSGQAMPRRKSSTEPLRAGYAGGWFHAATGYSFPLAVEFAQAVASTTVEQVDRAVNQLIRHHRLRNSFARFLNRLLFRLVKPATRWQIFHRFYRVLSPAAIARFYAHQFHAFDAARIIIGKPPGGLTPLRFLTNPEVRPCT